MGTKITRRGTWMLKKANRNVNEAFITNSSSSDGIQFFNGLKSAKYSKRDSIWKRQN